MWRLFLAGLLAVMSVSCGTADTPDDADDGLSVVAAFLPLVEMATVVGIEGTSVTNLTPAGAEPHDIELGSDEIDAIIDADVVLYLGGGFQPALEDALDRTDAITLDLLETLELRDGDPHVWLDPTLWTGVPQRVAKAFGAADRDNAGEYDSLAAVFSEEIASVDAEYRDGLADCESDLLVTNHASFGYLAARYGLRQESIAGLSPEAEPDPRRLAEIADLVDDKGVTTIFTEALLPSEVADTIARETGARTEVLDPYEGPRRAPQGPTPFGYVEVMRDNLQVLRAGLRCS